MTITTRNPFRISRFNGLIKRHQKRIKKLYINLYNARRTPRYAGASPVKQYKIMGLLHRHLDDDEEVELMVEAYNASLNQGANDRQRILAYFRFARRFQDFKIYHGYFGACKMIRQKCFIKSWKKYLKRTERCLDIFKYLTLPNCDKHSLKLTDLVMPDEYWQKLLAALNRDVFVTPRIL